MERKRPIYLKRWRHHSVSKICYQVDMMVAQIAAGVHFNISCVCRFAYQ